MKRPYFLWVSELKWVNNRNIYIYILESVFSPFYALRVHSSIKMSQTFHLMSPLRVRGTVVMEGSWTEYQEGLLLELIWRLDSLGSSTRGQAGNRAPVRFHKCTRLLTPGKSFPRFWVMPVSNQCVKLIRAVQVPAVAWPCRWPRTVAGAGNQVTSLKRTRIQILALMRHKCPGSRFFCVCFNTSQYI